MRCPSCGAIMYEIAPDLYQCSLCGSGPDSHGSNPTWALSFVSSRKCFYEATCVEKRGEGYVAYLFSWETDGDGHRIGVPQVADAILLEAPELEEFCLPVVVECSRPWELEPGSAISANMFSRATGPKKVIR